MGVEPKMVFFTPQIIHLFIGFGTIIFTIHFGGVPPYFWKHPHVHYVLRFSWHFQGAISIGPVERKHNSTLEPPEIYDKNNDIGD